MYCDRHGRPDPNGQFQMKDGKVILREGGRVSFDLSFYDSAPPSSSVFLQDTPVTFNDAERQLFDSAEGQSIIAYAKSKHRMGTAYLGDRAPEFTDAQAAAAIKAHVAQSERGRQYLAQMTAQNDELQRQAEQARREYVADLANRHRQR